MQWFKIVSVVFAILALIVSVSARSYEQIDQELSLGKPYSADTFAAKYGRRPTTEPPRTIQYHAELKPLSRHKSGCPNMLKQMLCVDQIEEPTEMEQFIWDTCKSGFPWINPNYQPERQARSYDREQWLDNADSVEAYADPIREPPMSDVIIRNPQPKRSSRMKTRCLAVLKELLCVDEIEEPTRMDLFNWKKCMNGFPFLY